MAEIGGHRTQIGLFGSDFLVDADELLELAELSQVDGELIVLHRLHGVLVLELRDEQIEELILADLVVRLLDVSGSTRSACAATVNRRSALPAGGRGSVPQHEISEARFVYHKSSVPFLT